MKSHYLHSLVQISSDEVIEVTLVGSSANVLVMDENNFTRYESGEQHHYYGGFYTKSPVVIRVPFSGPWHVVVDLGAGGHAAGDVRATIAVISPKRA